MSSNHRILVYRNHTLPISETFVYNQSVNLNRYEAFFLGAKHPPAACMELPAGHVCLINPGNPIGWLKEAIFKLVGYIPSDVKGWLRSKNPDILHAHFGPDGAVAIPLAKYLEIPLIVSFHGTDATTKDDYIRHSYLTHRLYLIRRPTLSRSAVRFIAQSDYLKDLLVTQHGFVPEKIEVIRHGIDLGVFNLEKVQPQWGKVLFVGRLIERKGLQYLIKALHIVKQKYPGVHLTVIGEGPDRGKYEKLAEEKLGNNFEFLGSQPNHVVRDYFKQSCLFSMPSIKMPSGEVETLGLVFLEAQAMKVPVVSFRTGGIPEVVLHEKTGFLAEEGDVEGLAGYLVALLGSRDLRERMGDEGRKWVEGNFDLHVQNEKLENLYDDVLSNWRMRQEAG